jgi:Flp pilus assembly protein TadD
MLMTTSSDARNLILFAEALNRDATEFEKSYWLNTLGAALYRAGRFDEAIRRLEEGLQSRGGGNPADWPLLAMADHRLGHRDQARLRAIFRGLTEIGRPQPTEVALVAG